MLPSTPEYFWFLALVFFAYWLVWRVRLAGIAVIVFANWFFFAKWGFIYLAMVPAAATIDFLIGSQLERSKDQAVRRMLITSSILLNVSLIALCKYVPFLLSGVGRFAGNNSATSWTLSLGLSFYAFQAMTYTLDIYRRDAMPAKSYWAYLASVSFFPTILAGPITRLETLLPQWEKSNRVAGGPDGGYGFFLIGLGLCKKFLIADYLGSNLIDRVFDLPRLYSSGELLIATYAYAFQLYYDFSGYTDIARGSALLLAINHPINFNGPYRSESIPDFWRRWHITLSNWLRDYLFFSLPGKRSKAMPYLNLIITFTIGGLWHGANWTFVIWGLLHGTGLAAVRLAQALRKEKPREEWRFRLIRIVVTFHFIAFAWIFFRSANLDTALQIVSGIAAGQFAFDNVTGSFSMVLAIAILAHFTPKRWYEAIGKTFSSSPAAVQAALLALLIVAIQYIGTTGAAPFIYTKF